MLYFPPVICTATAPLVERLPHCKRNLTYWRWSGAVFYSACCDAVDFGLLALMGSANRGCDASDVRWVVPVPGLTGLAITSRHSRNLMQPVWPG